MSFLRSVRSYRGRVWRRLPVVAAIAVCIVASLGGAGAATFQTLKIVTKTGVQTFLVEMATTGQEKAAGLMYRRKLADGKACCSTFRHRRTCRCG